MMPFTIPNPPGIPPLLNQVSQLVSAVALMTSDFQKIVNGRIVAQLTEDEKRRLQQVFSPPKWGVFLDGKIVLKPDSIFSMDAKREYRISNYPQEDGAFQAYNKVQSPYEAQLRMMKGGSTLDRQNFLVAVKEAAGSMNLYSILTPDVFYPNANITRYEYSRRPTEGVTLISVDIWFQEIRIAAAPSFSTTGNVPTLANTAAVSGKSNVQVGNVQTQPVTKLSPSMSLLE